MCCEKTKSGLFCQDVPEEECAADSRKPPTACESTSFCKPGFCFDSQEGTCLDNVPQKVCNDNGGTWTAEKPPQCDLGCCILGDQAAFVTLTRCKKLSANFGLQTNYNPNIQDETECILTAGAKEKGACVFEQDFELTCKLTTREECKPENIFLSSSTIAEQSRNGLGTDNNGSGFFEGLTSRFRNNDNNEPLTSPPEPVKQVEFHPRKLCSAEELGTNCGPTEKTICAPGKEEVYFVDTCGNPANIYDASKIRDKEYWANIKDKNEVCNPNLGNENSQSCGNCNYLLGTYCREAESVKPTYGTNICLSLNCVEQDGKKRFHGESWCGYDVEGYDFSPIRPYEGELTDSIANNLRSQISSRLVGVIDSALGNLGSDGTIGTEFLGSSNAPAGSRFFRYSCNNGEIIIEPCDDFRQHECIENTIETDLGKFTEAACRVNKWQDCVAQKNIKDCLNADARDCKWLEGIQYILFTSVFNGSSLDKNSLLEARERAKDIDKTTIPTGACVPKNPPGLRFWEGEEATGFCAQANAVCPVTLKKKTGGDWEPANEISELCLNQRTYLERAQLCVSLGDCGPKINIVGDKGYGQGYKVTKQKLGD